jgi:hypothetical protein
MKLAPIYQYIIESRNSEAQGVNLLKKGGVDNPESIISQFASGDASKNAKNIPVMAYLYANGTTDIKTIVDLLNEFDALEIKNRIKPIQLTKKSINIGDKQFKDFIQFSEYIHGETNKYTEKSQDSSNVEADFEAEKETLWSGNNIDIYDGTGVGKCISYTQGGLTGKGYGFCI